MAYVNDLNNAFMAAHAAGDVDAATMLAAEIQKVSAGGAPTIEQQQQQPAPIQLQQAAPVIAPELLNAPLPSNAGANYGAKPSVELHQKEIPVAEQIWNKVKPGVETVGQIIGQVGGGLAGSIAGPVGTVAGAGAGYAGANKLIKIVDEKFGGQAPESVAEQLKSFVKDMAIGSASEVVGQGAVKAVTKGISGIASMFDIPISRAAKIAREAVGPQLDKVIGTLKSTTADITPGQAVAGADITAPAFQALGKLGSNTIDGMTNALNRKAATETGNINALSKLAGGTNSSETIAATRQATADLADKMTPIRNKIFSNVVDNSSTPLTSDPIIQGIKSVASAPEYAGTQMSKVMDKVVSDIASATKNGIISPDALYAIRKNSVNSAIESLGIGLDSSAKSRMEAGMLSKLKPVIDNAIEAAGGKGWTDNYLKSYANKMTEINAQKLSGKALEMYKANPDNFVKLVQGESPQIVERMLGPGKYDIAKNVANDTMNAMKEVAGNVIRDTKVKLDSQAGEPALKELMSQNMGIISKPLSWLRAISSKSDMALNALENSVGPKTVQALVEAMKTPKGAADLLQYIPANQRSAVLNTISDPTKWVSTKRTVGATATNVTNNLLNPHSSSGTINAFNNPANR